MASNMFLGAYKCEFSEALHVRRTGDRELMSSHESKGPLACGSKSQTSRTFGCAASSLKGRKGRPTSTYSSIYSYISYTLRSYIYSYIHVNMSVPWHLKPEAFQMPQLLRARQLTAGRDVGRQRLGLRASVLGHLLGDALQIAWDGLLGELQVLDELLRCPRAPQEVFKGRGGLGHPRQALGVLEEADRLALSAQNIKLSGQKTPPGHPSLAPSGRSDGCNRPCSPACRR